MKLALKPYSLLCTIAFLLFLTNGIAQNAAIEGIQNNFDQQAACWNAGDLECYMQAYAPDETIQTISRGGVTKGHDAILKQYKSSFPPDRMGKLHFDQFEYKRLSNKYYYVIGRFNLNFPQRDEPYTGYFSVLMKKIRGNWYIVSDHSS